MDIRGYWDIINRANDCCPGYSNGATAIRQLCLRQMLSRLPLKEIFEFRLIFNAYDESVDYDIVKLFEKYLNRNSIAMDDFSTWLCLFREEEFESLTLMGRLNNDPNIFYPFVQNKEEGIVADNKFIYEALEDCSGLQDFWHLNPHGRHDEYDLKQDKVIKLDTSKFLDVAEASWWLTDHPIFQDENNFSYFYHHLDINYVKVDPRTLFISEDTDRNTKVQCWLESGPLIRLDEYGNKNVASHDIKLDCGHDSMELAMIDLAGLVLREYGDY